MWNNKERIRGRHWRLSVLILAGLMLTLAGCGASAVSVNPAPADDATRPIEDQLRKAFGTLPDEMANQDFTSFNQYVATAEQGADEEGLNQIFTWIQDVRQKGDAPADSSVYKLNELQISNIETRGNDATAHVYIDMSKIADGDTVNAAFVVEQDIALVQVEGRWLISGADPAQIKDLLAAPR
ncbi:MAG: hypothetical protein R2911_41315 [Caldilineaceae bacterium]